MRSLLLWCALLAFALPAHAQLVSPGRLSAPHEGVRTCTQCHELRQPGIAPERCLACHEVLARRMDAGTGYHARIRGRNCAQCHKDHLGRDAALVRFTPASFQHDSAGYTLRGSHATVSCRACHNAATIRDHDVRAHATQENVLERTYLGLATACAACHRRDSPHDALLNQRPCSECHDERAWDRTQFAHERTQFPLTGAHRAVACAACHERTKSQPRYDRLPHASCSDCHRDAHAGRFGATCTSCHQTTAWRAVDAARVATRFDHTRTAFALRGAHAQIDCTRCHDPARATRPGIRLTFQDAARTATFPRPVATACTACHVDAHEGVFRSSGGIACTRCHGEAAWTPVTFDVARHAAETRYALRGAHAAVACNACHAPAAPGRTPQFRFASVECSACHRNDPHEGRFGVRACSTCHADGSFRVTQFDHAGVIGECATCHERADPHGGQFGAQSCGSCHVTSTFRIATFDHTRTRFPLEGAHAGATCAGCHEREGAVVRYRGVPTTCAACHGGRT